MLIVDPENSQDSIFCRAKCSAWVHKYCTGLPVKAFLELKESSKPFVCQYCTLEWQANEISELKKLVATIQADISQLKISKTSQSNSITPVLPSQNQQLPRPSYASSVQPRSASTNQPIKRSSNKPASDRKFNIVMYGVRESPQHANRHAQLTSDVEAAASTLQTLDSKVTESSIHDCIRLGKYDSSRNRHLLVKLTCTRDASSILANRSKLASNTS